jgi:hypothetical protein
MGYSHAAVKIILCVHGGHQECRRVVDLILKDIGDLQLKDNLHAAIKNAIGTEPVIATTPTAVKILPHNIPEVGIEGIGLIDGQHDDLMTIIREHQYAIRPRP